VGAAGMWGNSGECRFMRIGKTLSHEKQPKQAYAGAHPQESQSAHAGVDRTTGCQNASTASHIAEKYLQLRATPSRPGSVSEQANSSMRSIISADRRRAGTFRQRRLLPRRRRNGAGTIGVTT